jgi:hypothetical protein
MMDSDNPQGIEDFSNDISESDAEALGSLFLNEDDPADEPAKEQPDDENVEDETEDNADADDEPQDDDAEEETEDEDTGDNEADLSFVDDNAVVKLDDGTTTTVKDLRLGNLRDADYRRKTMELADERRSFDERSTQIKQLEERTAQEREWMAQALKAVMPQKPDPSMMETDPIGYMQAEAALKNFQEQFGQLEQKRQHSQREIAEKQQAEAQQHLAREREAMFQANPDLQDQAKLSEFWQEASTTFSSKYGFEPNELNNIGDHRFVKVIRSAMAYDKLMAEKPKARKSLEGKPPVMKSNPRQGQKTRASKSVTDRISKAAQAGNAESISDLLGQLIEGN